MRPTRARSLRDRILPPVSRAVAPAALSGGPDWIGAVLPRVSMKGATRRSRNGPPAVLWLLHWSAKQMISKPVKGGGEPTSHLVPGPADPVSAARSGTALVGLTGRRGKQDPRAECIQTIVVGRSSLAAGLRQPSTRLCRALRCAATQEGDCCHPAACPDAKAGPFWVRETSNRRGTSRGPA